MATFRTQSLSIHDLREGDVVIPQTSEPMEWPVVKIEATGLRRNPYKITWMNGETTHHSAHAFFRVKR